MLTRSMARKRILADEQQGSSTSQEVEIRSEKKKVKLRKEKKHHLQLSGSIWMFCNKKLSKHGEVYEGEKIHGNFGSDPVAIKLVEHTEHGKAEARILAKLNYHSHVIALIESGIFKAGIGEQVYIVLDRCHNENLHEFIMNRKAEKFDFDRAILIAKQIIVGVEYIHDKNFIHKDLKPDNILFTLDQKTIKIADFGLSEEIESDSAKVFRKEPFGSSGYRSLESFGKGVISQKSDIFSLGGIFYFILSNGKNPFGEDPSIWNSNIKKCIFDLSHLLAPNVKTFQHLIKHMISPKLNDRPTIWQVSEHPCWTGNEVECDFDYRSEETFDIVCTDEQIAPQVSHDNDSVCEFLEMLKKYAPNPVQDNKDESSRFPDEEPNTQSKSAEKLNLTPSVLFANKIIKQQDGSQSIHSIQDATLQKVYSINENDADYDAGTTSIPGPSEPEPTSTPLPVSDVTPSAPRKLRAAEIEVASGQAENEISEQDLSEKPSNNTKASRRFLEVIKKIFLGKRPVQQEREKRVIIGQLATSSGQVTTTRTETKEEYNVKSAGE